MHVTCSVRSNWFVAMKRLPLLDAVLAPAPWLKILNTEVCIFVQGNIVTCAGTNVCLWSINGQLLAYASALSSNARHQQITSLAMSCLNEWDPDAVIATGHADGHVRVSGCVYFDCTLLIGWKRPEWQPIMFVWYNRTEVFLLTFHFTSQ